MLLRKAAGAAALPSTWLALVHNHRIRARRERERGRWCFGFGFGFGFVFQCFQQASYTSNKRQFGCLWWSQGEIIRSQVQREILMRAKGSPPLYKTTDNVTFIFLPRPAIWVPPGSHIPPFIIAPFLFLILTQLTLQITQRYIMYCCSIPLITTIVRRSFC